MCLNKVMYFSYNRSALKSQARLFVMRLKLLEMMYSYEEEEEEEKR